MATRTENAQMILTIDGKQSINEIGKIESELADAKNAMKALKRGTEEYIAAGKNIDLIQEKLKQVREAAGLAGMSFRQLSQYQTQLNRDIRNMTAGTDAYRELQARLQAVNTEIQQQRAHIQRTGTAWSRFQADFRMMGAMAIGNIVSEAAMAAVVALGAAIAGLISRTAELSDAFADIRKTTGMSAAEVDKLSKSLSMIDTRTARKELLALATIAGKLGIQSVEDVAGFVRAADKINVALGEDLGEVETVMKELGKLTETFGIKAMFGVEDSLLKVGSAINKLGSSSTASEGYLVDFAKRMGGIAPLAGISIQDILALGATLDQLGQTSETSSTALSKMFLKMASESETYAKQAGMSVKDFSALMKKDALGAFAALLENVGKNSKGITALAGTLGELGVEGGRVTGVLGVLANNTDLLRKQQAISNDSFRDGTSILEEFDAKNNTMAANLEKIQKAIMGALMPAGLQDFLTSATEKLAKLVEPSIETKTKAITKALYDESQQIMLLGMELNETNITQNRRNEIIAILQKNYGAYLHNMKLDEMSNQKIGEAIRIANTHIINQIVLEKQKGKIAEIGEKAAEARIEMLETESKLREQMLAAEKKLGIKITGFSPEESAKQFLEITRALERENLDKWAELNQKGMFSIARKTAELLPQFRAAKNDLSAATTEMDNLRKSSDAFVKESGLDKILNPETPAEKKGQPIEDTGAPSATTVATAKSRYDELLKAWQSFHEKISTEKQQAEAKMLDADMQELAAIDLKYETLWNEAAAKQKELLAAKSLTDEQMKGLENKYNEDIDAIKAAHTAESEAWTAAKNAKIIADEAEKNAKLKEDRRTLLNELATIGQTEEQAEIARVEAHYLDLLARAAKFGIDIAGITAAMEVDLAAVRKKYDEKELAEKQALNDQKMGMITQFGGLVSATNEFVGQQGADMAEFQKALGLVEIGISTGVAIAKSIQGASSAAAAGGPAAPFLIAGYIATMVGSVIGAAAKANSLVKKQSVPSPPSTGKTASSQETSRPGGRAYSVQKRAEGGYTGYGLTLLGERGTEYVLPNDLLNRPEVSAMADYAEGLRTGNGGKYQSGAIPVDNTGIEKLLGVLIEKTDRLAMAVETQKKEMKAYIRYTDIELENEKVAAIKKDAAL